MSCVKIIELCQEADGLLLRFLKGGEMEGHNHANPKTASFSA